MHVTWDLGAGDSILLRDQIGEFLSVEEVDE
jgi:hypothetical protein